MSTPLHIMGLAPLASTEESEVRAYSQKRHVRMNSLTGFTLVEILVVLAVLLIIAAFSITAFRSMYEGSGTRTAVVEITDALREARNNALSSKGDSVYGVRIASTSVTRFPGSTYSAGNASNTTYMFEAGAMATGTLVSAGTDIVFARLTGMPSATGTVLVTGSDGTSTTTITIGATGLIQY
jgi:prepilin-type N-terminal cleavage/methylation domain-containing protein